MMQPMARFGSSRHLPHLGRQFKPWHPYVSMYEGCRLASTEQGLAPNQGGGGMSDIDHIGIDGVLN